MIFNLKVWKQPACDEYRYQVTETLSQVSVMSLSPFMNWVSLKLTNFNSDESESSIGQICSVSLSPTGSPWRGGDVVVYVFDINLLSLPTPFFYSVLVSVSVFIALSAVLHSKNSVTTLHFLTVLVVFFSAYWSFQVYIYLFMKVSFSPDVILCGWLGLKHQLTNWLVCHCRQPSFSTALSLCQCQVCSDFQIVKDGAAAKSNLKIGDRILSVSRLHCFPPSVL